MQIIYSPKFARLYKKIPAEIKRKAESKEVLFRDNPFTKVLKTHKLGGKLAGLHAFSIDQSYRIIFEFNSDQSQVIFHSVGSHDIYK